MFYISIYYKALLMGFTNGLFLGRKIRTKIKFQNSNKEKCHIIDKYKSNVKQ
jgi:hypothetical protein